MKKLPVSFLSSSILLFLTRNRPLLCASLLYTPHPGPAPILFIQYSYERVQQYLRSSETFRQLLSCIMPFRSLHKIN